MQSPLVSFINVLRSHDVRISPAETLDAMHAMQVLGYADREYLRMGLASTLAKTPAEKIIFNRCFDNYFAPASDVQSDKPGNAPAGPRPDQEPSAELNADLAPTVAGSDPLDLPGENDAALAGLPALQSLLQAPLMQQLRDGEREHLAMDIARAAERAGLSDIKMFTQKGIYTRKILDEMGEEQLRRAVIELEQADSDLIQPVRYYRDALREQVRDYVERQYLLHAEGKNKQFMEDILSRARLNNIEHRYMDRVQELVRKMARKLAHKHSRKRKIYRRGQLNMARTIGRGIATDGVMFETFWKSTRRDKPQLLAICDVSGSVASYSKFLLLFLYSLYEILPRVRSFAFSNHLGEVSELFEQYPVEQAVEMVNRQYGGATDYAGSLVDFARLAMDDINSNTTVIILGDARNNNGDPRLDIMQSIYARARQVIWLNPESRQAWGSGDSEMRRYQSACHFTAECNSLQQLERVVDQLLKNTR